ncbi:transcription factor [Scheffersomyces xylosifermentans]|uniref:transcription factor n=1 Tax=Scheffersomyces xylosifermentans TaxID=1304137 RepID=UPI00315E016F
MSNKKIAEKHSMDIPHVTAVELPLIVNNTDRAIGMIGGKQKISSVINSPDKSGNLNNHTMLENTLELRLRKDPHHHPIQSSFNTSEKILLKVSIPKGSIPKDYKENPSKYSIKDLIELNDKNTDTPKHRTQPVAIIDKTYSFKSIADFQISTKNNSMVQDFNKSILHSNRYDTLQQYFEKHEKFNGISDYKDNNGYYQNIDHQLPPPPILSPIRFPYDYRYQKNPFTTAVKDAQSGDVKVFSTKQTVKLFTKMIDYNTAVVPDAPAEQLIANLKELESKKLAVNTIESELLRCINWLKTIFEIKPIWLRKQLEDIVSEDLKRFIKQALPYVTYIYKSGPWRFCNIKFGVDPKKDPSYWIYQSEYFRIPGLKFVMPRVPSKRIVPNTVIESNKRNKKGPHAEEVQVSEYLFFNGVTLPSTVTYQMGDILDLDIATMIEDHQSYFGQDFWREAPDFQDGWINRQTMEIVRRIIRYKLDRIVKEEPMDQNKIYKIMNTDYTGNDDTAIDVDEEVKEEEDVDVEVEREEIQAEEDESEEPIDEENLMNRIAQLNEDGPNKLSELIGFIKQDLIDDE